MVKHCEKKKNQYARNGGVSRADDQNDSDTVRGQTYLRLVVNGKPSKCLLDTGSDVTLLPSSVVTGLIIIIIIIRFVKRQNVKRLPWR